MLFFKRILKSPPPEARRKERRTDRRLTLSASFPLKAMLVFSGRGGTVAPMSAPGGWDWPGKLLDCSIEGARMLLAPAALAVRGDFCDLDLRLDGFRLFVPTKITNIRIERDGVHFGLKHGAMDEATRAAYGQLVEIVALATTLKPAGKAKVDDSGYAVETFSGDGSRLTVWREKSGRKAVAAVEFALQDCLIRVAKGQTAEYLAGNRPAAPTKAAEIGRLFGWVTSNLPAAVPADVRAFLQRHAG
jgi:hypothetical protein